MLRVHLSKHLETRMKWTHSVLLVLLSLSLSAPGFAQWSKRLDPAVPSTRDGKLDLAARPPKTGDGYVDLSGVSRTLPDPLGKPQTAVHARRIRTRDGSAIRSHGGKAMR